MQKLFAVQSVLLAYDKKSGMTGSPDSRGRFMTPTARGLVTRFVSHGARPLLRWCGCTILTRKPFTVSPGTIVNLNSMFDHDLPTYQSITGENDDGIVENFINQSKSNASLSSCQLGYSCYDGHDGIDYNTLTNSIYPAAPGVVQSYHPWGAGSHAFGNAIFLKHDTNNDGVFDFVTSYNHLQDTGFHEGLSVGSSVTMDQKLGNSGGTGISTSSYSAHLHFGVRKIVYDVGSHVPGSEDPYTYRLLDPYGWWGDDTDDHAAGEARATAGGLFQSIASHWLWKATQDNGQLIDDMDVSFQHFENADAPGSWYPVTRPGSDPSVVNGRALYTQASYHPARQWDNWAFWVPNLPAAGRYQIEVFVPNIASVTGVSYPVTAEARYIIYQKNGDQVVTTTVAIDQTSNLGQWVTLGEYAFATGASAAVQLVDEVSNSENQNRIIWADAVRFTQVESQTPTAPDVVFVTDSLRLVRTTLESADKQIYDIVVTVRNDGEAAMTSGVICFLTYGASPSTCASSTPLPRLSPGSEETIHYSFAESPGTNILGSLQFRNILPRESTTAGKSIPIDMTALTADPFTDPGGVDFTFAEITGIEVDPETNNLEFAIRSEELGLGVERN